MEKGGSSDILSSSSKLSSESELKPTETTASLAIIQLSDALQEIDPNCPDIKVSTANETSESDTQCQASKISTSEHIAKPLPSPSIGDRVTNIDMYHSYGCDIGIIEHCDDWGDYHVRWSDGWLGRYQIHQLIIRSLEVDDLITQSLTNAIQKGLQAAKVIVRKLVTVWGKLTVLAASFALDDALCQQVRMLVME